MLTITRTIVFTLTRLYDYDCLNIVWTDGFDFVCINQKKGTQNCKKEKVVFVNILYMFSRKREGSFG